MVEGGDARLEKIVRYMKAHWPSKVKDEWQVGLMEYPEILSQVLKDFCEGRTRERNLVRTAGISGAGKTTQLLPAAEAYFEKKELKPVLVAARRFAPYHPHFKEIMRFYGESEVRKMTDEFATIMMFMVLAELLQRGYDVLLDVTLLDPEMEGILVEMAAAAGYELLLLIIAVSPEVAERHLSGREWRHTRETEAEFLRATSRALEFYAESVPEMRVVMWNAFEEEPVYDGAVRGAISDFKETSSLAEIPEHDPNVLREAKIKYLMRE